MNWLLWLPNLGMGASPYVPPERLGGGMVAGQLRTPDLMVAQLRTAGAVVAQIRIPGAEHSQAR